MCSFHELAQASQAGCSWHWVMATWALSFGDPAIDRHVALLEVDEVKQCKKLSIESRRGHECGSWVTLTWVSRTWLALWFCCMTRGKSFKLWAPVLAVKQRESFLYHRVVVSKGENACYVLAQFSGHCRLPWPNSGQERVAKFSDPDWSRSNGWDEATHCLLSEELCSKCVRTSSGHFQYRT